MNRSMGEKIFLQNPWIPPQREIWSESDGSHPEKKFGLEATDPTPKRNLIKEGRIPPRRKFRVGKQTGEKKWSWPRPKKVDLDFKVMTSK